MCNFVYNGDNIARPILPNTEVWVKESRPVTDSSSLCGMEPDVMILLIMEIHVFALSGGSLI